MLNNTSRFLLTDVLPYEIPVIFTNKNFVYYISKNYRNTKFYDFEKALKKHSVPFKFKIIKDSNVNRTISLMNPIAQLQSLYFIEKYQYDILQYVNIYGLNSLRKPSDVSPIYLSDKLKKKIFNKIITNAESLNIDNLLEDIEISPFFESYFSNTPYSRIHEFQDDGEIIKLERRFKYLLKTDLQDCFNSIYTHSVSWSYTGDKDIAKEKTSHNSFDKMFDTLMQKSNYKETNGILIGSNLSRIFAEIIFCKIDYSIIKELKNENLKENKDFKYYRYIDDIFVFSNDRTELELIRKCIERNFESFNLRINMSKTYIDQRPFSFNRNWYFESKEIISSLESFNTNERLTLDSLIEGKDELKNIFVIDYKLMFLMIKGIIKKYPSSEIRIGNYLSSSLIGVSFTMMNHISKLDESKKSNYLKQKHIESFFNNLMNMIVYITAINLSYSSVNNLFQFISLMKINYVDIFDNSRVKNNYHFIINDIENIIESNFGKTEVSNLIILLSLIQEEININSLKHFFKCFNETEDYDIFIFIALAFYVKNNISNLETKNEFIDLINKIVNKRIDSFINSSYFSNTSKTNVNDFSDKAIRSNQYYFLNAFYHYPLTSLENKKNIEKLIYNPKYKSSDKIMILMSGFKGSFIDWDQKLEDSLKILLLNKKISTQNSDI
ncbi:MAG: RNA-directed DNA polymerase [Acholeplasmataceae bacterium]|nr:RNA-directed DNA polymerase [Acholeplasmataceae bacterium]